MAVNTLTFGVLDNLDPNAHFYTCSTSSTVLQAQQITKRYMVAKAAPMGSSFYCPVCGTKQQKVHPLQTFCNFFSANCEKAYWDVITPPNH